MLFRACRTTVGYAGPSFSSRGSRGFTGSDPCDMILTVVLFAPRCQVLLPSSCVLAVRGRHLETVEKDRQSEQILREIERVKSGLMTFRTFITVR